MPGKAMIRLWAHLLLTHLLACSSLSTSYLGSPFSKDGGACGSTVSFLFLARDGLPLEEVWRKFLDGCAPGSYTVHIHSQYSKLPPASLPEAHMVEDPIQSNLRYNYTMQQAMHKLYRDADAGLAPNGCKPRWAQMLSDSCAPVESCADYQAFLGRHSNISFLDSWMCTVGAEGDRCYERKPQQWDQPWYKAHQWSTLCMDHAKMLLDHEKENERMWLHSFCPDEHYTINLLNAMGARHKTFGLTHIYPFIYGLGGHPPTISCNATFFHRRNVVPFNESVEDLDDSAHTFFSRKYDTSCADDLLRSMPNPAGGKWALLGRAAKRILKGSPGRTAAAVSFDGQIAL